MSTKRGHGGLYTNVTIDKFFKMLKSEISARAIKLMVLLLPQILKQEIHPSHL